MDGHYPTAITRLGSAGGVETTLAAEADLAALADAALRELADALGAEVGALWGAREAGGPLALLAVRGLARDSVPVDVVPGAGLPGRALTEARAITAAHGPSGLEVVGLAGATAVRHEVHLPLRLGREVLGVAALGTLAEAPPPAEQLVHVQRLADAAGVALAHLQVQQGAQRQARLGRAILDATPDAIALLGADGEVLVENEPMRALRATGVPALEGLGNDPEEERADELAPRGTRRVLARWVAPLRDVADGPAGRVVTLRDITAERESERTKDEILALVSHELRTPLTSIVGYVELVLDGAEDLSPDVRRFLEIVERNARRLLRLVGDLLFVAQAEAGRLELSRTPVDLGEVTSNAVEAARPEAERAGTTIVLDAEPVRPFRGDRDRCAQVLDNLIANAVKFSGDGGHVQVTVTERGEEAVLEVSDDGPGIPLEEQELVFERFARASTATERAVPGAGLGLTVVRTIVEAHDGRIDVLSAPGAGTTVRVALPLTG